MNIVYQFGQHYSVRVLEARRGRRRQDEAHQVAQGPVMDRVLLTVSGPTARAQVIDAAAQAGGAVVLAGGRPIAGRSCATCFDQTAPDLACPSCSFSGSQCQLGLSENPAKP